MKQQSSILTRLTKSELQTVARHFGMAVSGSKAALIQRLSVKVKAKRKTVTRAQYRRRLRKLGLIESDQDVFHIIAVSNGGVDHPDNYHYAQNSSHNRSIGCRYDHVNCYLAGRTKARKAVAICKRLGTYRGPSAAKLYKAGEKFWKTLHQHNK